MHVIHATQRHRHTSAFLAVWKAARSVWHWLRSANSTLGDALASFAANPGKEITDTHNAVFCLSAKKKTSPLSPERGGRGTKTLKTNSPPSSFRTKNPFVSRNMASNMGPGSNKAPLWLKQFSLHFLILLPNTVAHYYYLHHSSKEGIWLTIRHAVITEQP